MYTKRCYGHTAGRPGATSAARGFGYAFKHASYPQTCWDHPHRQPTTDGRQPLRSGPSVAAQEPRITDDLPLYDAPIIVFASNG